MILKKPLKNTSAANDNINGIIGIRNAIHLGKYVFPLKIGIANHID